MLVSQTGTPGDSLETMIPNTGRVTVTLKAENGVIELTQQASVFVHRNGDSHAFWTITEGENLRHELQWDLLDSIYMGCFLMLCFVHVVLFLLMLALCAAAAIFIATVRQIENAKAEEQRLALENAALDHFDYNAFQTSDSIPLEKSMRDGHSRNVVILTRHNGYQKQPEGVTSWLGSLFYANYPRTLEAGRERHNMYNRQLVLVAEQERLGNALVICPKCPVEIGRAEKDTKKAWQTREKKTESCKNCGGTEQCKWLLLGVLWCYNWKPKETAQLLVENGGF